MLAEMYEQSFVNFSDLSVRITNVLSKTNKVYQIGILFHELVDLLHIQLALLQKGVLLRGGVTIHGICHSASFTFGPGLIHAYRLESQRAQYPRILLDSEALSLLKESHLLKAAHHDFETEQEYVKALICQFEDDEWFIDYLRAAEPECDDATEYLEFLALHKRLVLERYGRFRYESRIAQKYLWLARYHNEVVSGFAIESFRRYGRQKRDLKISKAELGDTWTGAQPGAQPAEGQALQ